MGKTKILMSLLIGIIVMTYIGQLLGVSVWSVDRLDLEVFNEDNPLFTGLTFWEKLQFFLAKPSNIHPFIALLQTSIAVFLFWLLLSSILPGGSD